MILGTGQRIDAFRIALIGFVVLCLCVSCWGACYDRVVTSGSCGPNNSFYNCAGASASHVCDGVEQSWSCGNGTNTKCAITNVEFSYCYYGFPNFSITITTCDEEGEWCQQHPDAEGCTNACTADKNDCESRGGEWQGQPTSDSTCTSTCNLCNTEIAKITEDYVYKSCCAGGMTPVYSCGYEGIPLGNTMVFGEILQATCNSANWETNKICEDYFSSSSVEITSSVSERSSSSSDISEYCQLFPTDLQCKCEVNPDSPDCDYLNSSSSEGSGDSGSSSEGSGGSGSSSEGSSGSGGGIGGFDSSGSGGGIGGGGDWEYDYRDSLHRIINATTRTANNTGEIVSNTGMIKSILQQARCLFVDCTDYGAIKDALDSNVNIPSGDTAGVLDSMARLNNLDSLGGYIDGINWASYGDSIDGALNELGTGVDGLFTDSGLYGPMNDYRDLIEDKFPTAQWSYTSACPTALNSTITFNFPAPIGTISAGRSLGGYFCGPLPPFNITLGNMIRAVIRLALTIAMAMGIFKAATGFKNE